MTDVLALPPGERTLPTLLVDQAAQYADAVLVRSEGGERTFAEMRDAVACRAGWLAGAGALAGDRIAIMSENRLEVLDLWLGAAWLGAVTVMVNSSLRGPQLEHVLRDSSAKMLVLEEELVPALGSLEETLPALERIYILGRPSGSWRGYELQSLPSPVEPVPPRPGRSGDTTMILYTSGTTGRPKGVLRPNAQMYWSGLTTRGLLGIREGDVLYTCLPLFHTNALNTFVQALVAGATFTPGPRFSASAFWERLTASGATVTYLLGVMTRILAQQPPGPFDRAHRTRIALAPGTSPELYDVFRERFGIELVDAWASTETNVVLASAGVDAPAGSMGTVVDGFEAIVVDEDDVEVEAGRPGELVVRTRRPFAFSTGYLGLPEKTVEAWRNLWFHTGDAVMRDSDGWFWFLGRLGDAIRRRGENISASEVEEALVSHRDVAAAAVVAVPAELGEDDILAFVVPRASSRLEPESLIAHCSERLAYFAVPRFIDFVDELPVTANGKVERFRLRERGVTGSAWDRERADRDRPVRGEVPGPGPSLTDA